MFSDLTATEILIVLVSILVSMAIHEAMHAYTAHWLGDSTAEDLGRLTLNPLKHVDLYTTILLPLVLILAHLQPFFIAKPVPFNPSRVKYREFGAALVGIAGPLTNLVLATVAALIFRQVSSTASTLVYNSLLLFTEVNVAFFIFNMIPIPPLDGSRLLYAVAPEWLQRIMQQIESAGFFMIIIFMLLLFPVIAPAINSIETNILTFLLG